MEYCTLTVCFAGSSIRIGPNLDGLQSLPEYNAWDAIALKVEVAPCLNNLRKQFNICVLNRSTERGFSEAVTF